MVTNIIFGLIFIALTIATWIYFNKNEIDDIVESGNIMKSETTWQDITNELDSTNDYIQSLEINADNLKQKVLYLDQHLQIQKDRNNKLEDKMIDMKNIIKDKNSEIKELRKIIEKFYN